MIRCVHVVEHGSRVRVALVGKPPWAEYVAADFDQFFILRHGIEAAVAYLESQG